jgi:hypothetical protein
MTIDDIIALCKAGYTKDDLAKLVTFDNAAPAAPAAPAAHAAPAAPTAPAAHAAHAQDADGIIAAINALGAQIKTMNIAATEQPKTQTAEDVLASIILPPKPATQK